MQDELKQAYVERKMEADPNIRFFKENEVGDIHLESMIARQKETYEREYDSSMAAVMNIMEENGIEEDVFFGFDVIVKDLLMSLAEANSEMEERLGDWEYYADELYDNISSAISDGRPW
tara:strand:- start:1806 stop:2162 length:357 start_codon:yes stop_codon:yes gene_type:complete